MVINVISYVFFNNSYALVFLFLAMGQYHCKSDVPLVTVNSVSNEASKSVVLSCSGSQVNLQFKHDLVSRVEGPEFFVYFFRESKRFRLNLVLIQWEIRNKLEGNNSP
jgi:hypothetical protein